MRNNIKKATALIISGLITIAPLTAYAKTTVKVNNINHEVVSEPLLDGETTLVGLREFCDLFGAYIEWFPSSKEILIQEEATIITLKIDSKEVTINGEKSNMAIAPKVVNGVTMVPIDFIATTFDVAINIDSENNSINIVDGNEGQVLIVPDSDGVDITFEEVLKKVVTSSDTLKKNADSIETTEKNFKENPATGAIEILNRNLSLENLRLAEKKTMDSFNSQVVSSLDNIINLESSIELQKLKLENEASDLEILKQKHTLGLTSKLDLDSSKTKYEKSQISFANLKESLESAYRSFNILINDTVDTKYNIVYTPEYIAVEFGSLDNYIGERVHTSYVVKTSENALKMKQNSVDYYGTDASVIGTYDTIIKSLDQAQRDHKDLITNLTEKMNNTYTSIKQQEVSYELAVADLEQAKKDYELSKVKYNIGTIALISLNQARLNVASNEYNVQTALTKLVELNLKLQNADL